MEALSHYRVAYLLTLGFFVLGLGSWSLFLVSGSLAGPVVLFLAAGLWAGLLEAHMVHRGKLPHPVGAATLLLLGPMLLVTSDLVGRSVSGEVLGMEVFVRWASYMVAAFTLLALLAHFVALLTLGLDRYLERVRL